VPKAFKDSSTTLVPMRADMMITVVICLLGINVLSILASGLNPDLSTEDYLVSVLMVLILSAGYLAALLSLKFQGNLVLAVNIFSMVSTLIIIGLVPITGGVSGPITPLSVVIPVWAFLMGGRRVGLLWFAIVVIVMSTIYVLGLTGVNYSQSMPAEAIPSISFLIWLMAVVISIACFSMYERYMNNLVIDVNNEKKWFEKIATTAVDNQVVQSSCDELNESSTELLKHAEDQRVAAEQLSVTVEEVSASASSSMSLATTTKQSLSASEQDILTNKIDCDQLEASFEEILRSSQDIKSINSVIDDIAQQTNLLSLNAMIEAARLGEKESGFKVVALEVKQLAERSTSAVTDIMRILDENIKTVGSGAELAGQMKARAENAAERIKPVMRDMVTIENSSIEQTQAIGQIVEGIQSVNLGIEANEKVARITRNNSVSLQNQALALIKMFSERPKNIRQL